MVTLVSAEPGKKKKRKGPKVTDKAYFDIGISIAF